MKKMTVLAASALAVAGFGAADASAVDVELYGQVDKSLMVFDDGRDTETNVVDNDFGGTRFGFKGSQGLDNGLIASVLFESELQSNPSNTITQNTTANQSSTPAPGAGTLAERHARVGLAGDWGAVFLGQASSATDSSLEQDLAGVNDVLGSSAFKIGGGVAIRTNTGALSGYTVGGSMIDFDGLGRADIVRYDSPIFEGFQLRVSTAQGGDIDGAVYYNGKVDAFAVKGALGYVAYNSSATTAADLVEDQWMGSLSVKHDSGLAGTVAYGSQDLQNKTAGNDDPTYWYVKLGYSWDAFEVAADYAKAEDNMTTTTTDHEVQYIGVGAQYDMGNGVSTAVYYKQFDLDFTGTNTDEVNLYGVNLKVKF